MRRKEKTFSGVDKQINEILDIAHAFEKSQTLLAATQLDIFTVIDSNTMTAEDVATEIGADVKATTRLMDALCALDLLEKSFDKYYNTQRANDYLVKGKPGFIGGLEHIYYLMDGWDNLVNTVISGKPKNQKRFDYKDENRKNSYLKKMYWHGNMQAPYVIKWLNLKNVHKVLDLGGATGSYSKEFAKAKQDIHVVLFDKPEVTPIAKEYLEMEELDNKIDIVSGNFFVDDLGDNYDLVFVSFILENFSFMENIKLLRRVYDSMNAGGTIVLQELLLDEGRTSPEYNALFSLNMLVNTENGDVYTETDTWIMLKEAWFSDINVIKTEFDNSLIFGTKK